VDFANLRIYGLLTDLTQFRFYSYDPLSQNFAIDEILIVNSTRDFVFADMIPVSNKIFSVILTAYIDGLEATTAKNIEKKSKGDISSSGSAPLQQLRSQNPPSERWPSRLPNHNGGRKSTDRYEVALQLAKQCREKFDESVRTIDDVENNSTAALELLARSVRSIPRVSLLTGKYDPSSTEEIKDLAHRMVHQKYLDMAQVSQHLHDSY